MHPKALITIGLKEADEALPKQLVVFNQQ
ncbi:hypothetical protein MED222_05005 [Vibrio sp. MED222]|nr:hypothetical protein MED222_05005 [Vibrio sp. MED222]